MLSPDLIDRFTAHLKEALQKALSFTIMNGRDTVEPGDLLVGLLHEKGSIASEILAKQKVVIEKTEKAFRGFPAPATNIVTPDLSPAVKKIIEKCVLTAHLHEHKYVGTEHLLFALLDGDASVVDAYLREQKINILEMREQITTVLKSTSRFPELAEQLESSQEGEDPAQSQQASMNDPRMPGKRGQIVSALDSFTHELTRPHIAEQLDPVIGRQNELERVIQILCRRTKNNPILLGEPGVGKTAIVEGLAKRLADGDVPEALYGKKLLSLDLAMTVAGTMYRGEFEGRLKQIIDEAKADPNVILFIDEIHNIVGAGSTSGSLDAANILKPALARGEIRCVGATTWAEYKKHIEPDAALERRFQPIAVEEPTPEATIAILEGLLPSYAKHHRVTYAEDVVPTAVRLAERYLTDRYFPDKAIDLIDEAAASVIAKRSVSEERERLTTLDLAISAAEEHKQEAVRTNNLPAAETAAKEIQELQAQADALQKIIDQKHAKDVRMVNATDIADIIARMTGATLNTVLATDREQLHNLQSALQENIFGQDEAVEALSDVVTRSRLGFSDPSRPKAAMLFVGPSGTGKTELARRLAKLLFVREDALIKIDMSEFSEGHSVAKLVGSPAGYVGYRDSNKFTDAIRKRPHSVVLFDEFEKAHPDVQNILLQILEDGKLSDGTGRHIPFRHSYIIITSNAGSERLAMKSLGFTSKNDNFSNEVKEELKQRFRPELLNRLDRVIVFKPLDKQVLRTILRRELNTILERIEQAQHISWTAGDDVIEWLSERPLPEEEGARAIRHLIEREVTAVISRLLTEKPNKKKIQLTATKHGLKLR
ncbi:ATP-dependent Clp protease ATP-binding subunit [Candidatus Uhrbacteria bacterium]|nr:ATP-dependent Clp protease ATP-binding subunit [Candidatus Uhrbacteria bacterium]